MSNEVKMVSVPRNLLERCKCTLSTRSQQKLIDDIESELTKPAEQHQGEPVAWIVHWADDGSFYTFTRDKTRSEKLRNDPEFISTPLYTHADAGEVELLREELSMLRDEDLKWQGLREQEAEIDTLRAQLAEQDALLAEARRCVAECADPEAGGPTRRDAQAILNKIDAALSSSAEPSVPKCGNCGSSTGQACNDKGCGYLEAGNGEPSAQQYQKCSVLKEASVRYSNGSQGYVGPNRLSQGGEPSAPVERDEHKVNAADCRMKDAPSSSPLIAVGPQADFDGGHTFIVETSGDKNPGADFFIHYEGPYGFSMDRYFLEVPPGGVVTVTANGRDLKILCRSVERAEISLDQAMRAYEYAEYHPHKYLRGTTNWCAALAHSLNVQARAALERKP